MAELLLVNPSRRKRKVAKKAKRRSNPISKADAKNVRAALKSPHVTKKEKASLRAAIKAMHKADRDAASGIAPRKRKTTKRKAAVAKTARKTARKSSRKIAKRVRFTKTEARKYRGIKPNGKSHPRRSRSVRVNRAARTLGKRSAAWRIYGINPLNVNSLKSLALPALAGAMGGFAINTAFDKLETYEWFPNMLKDNEYAKAGAKALLAIGASMALAKVKFISPSNRNAALGGALVIIAYDLLDGTLFPKVKEALGMDGYQLAGYQDVAGLGEFEYIDPTDEGDMAGLGYVSSAPVVGFSPAARSFTG